MSISVLTLVRGREDRLRRLIDGLRRQTRPPDELVIAAMGDDPRSALPETGFPVRIVPVPGAGLPLAAARNAAADRAVGSGLVFLDVDCIPASGTIAAYAAALGAQHPAVFLGEVRYLPAGLPARLDDPTLDALALSHPARRTVPGTGLIPEPDAGQLWGLSFALARDTWDRVGGMDPAFTGYGGEETDLAARLAAAGVPSFWVGGALAFHQHHPVHSPPLNHFSSILRNAELFHARHGRWCMEYWLDGFAALGLIRRHPDRIERVRDPVPAEIAASLAPPDARWG